MANSPEIKQRAIALRKQGLTYREIRTRIPVAKSTLSDWLSSVGLTKEQHQRITEKRISAQKKGAFARKKERIDRESAIKFAARAETPLLIRDPLWLAGVMLYWGEGSKQKPWTPSVGVRFMNMDVASHILFIKWSKQYLRIKQKDLRFEIYLHEKANTREAKKYWAEKLAISEKEIKVYYKKHNLNPYRKNIAQEYHGVLRTSISRSTYLNRKIAGWTEGVISYLT